MTTFKSIEENILASLELGLEETELLIGEVTEVEVKQNQTTEEAIEMTNETTELNVIAVEGLSKGNNKVEIARGFVERHMELKDGFVSDSKSLETSNGRTYNLFNHGRNYADHIAIDNATIGQTAEEVLVLYSLYYDKDLAVSVLKRVFGTKGKINSYSPLVGEPGETYSEFVVIKIDEAKIKEVFKVITELNFDDLSAESVRAVISDIGHCKNAESQIVIDAAKKFYSFEQNQNFLKHIALISRSNKVEFYTHANSNTMKDYAAMNKENANSDRYFSNFYEVGSHLVTNIDQRETFESSTKLFIKDPMQDARVKSIGVIGKIADLSLGNYYPKVTYKEAVKRFEEVINLSPERVITSFKSFKIMFDGIRSILSSNEMMARNEMSGGGKLSLEDEEAIQAAVRSERNTYFGLVRSAAYTALNEHVEDASTFGVLALNASYDGNWDSHPSTFGTTIFPRETYLANATYLDETYTRTGKNGEAEEVLATTTKVGVKIETLGGDKFEEGDVIVTDNMGNIQGTNSRLAKIAPAGEYNVHNAKDGSYAYLEFKDVSEKYLVAPEKKTAVISLNTGFESEEEIDDKGNLINKYSDQGSQLESLIHKYNKADDVRLFVVSDTHFGEGLYAEKADGSVELLSEIYPAYSEINAKIYDRRYVTVKESFTGSTARNKFRCLLFIEVEGSLVHEKVPYLANHTAFTSKGKDTKKPDGAFAMSNEDLALLTMGAIEPSEVMQHTELIEGAELNEALTEGLKEIEELTSNKVDVDEEILGFDGLFDEDIETLDDESLFDL